MLDRHQLTQTSGSMVEASSRGHLTTGDMGKHDDRRDLVRPVARLVAASNLTCDLSFFLIWNQMAAGAAAQPESKPSKSSSSSSSQQREKKEEKKEKKAEPKREPSPWDEMRAHPSAFLTTRLNRLIAWPFPMGKAAAVGNELWWESGIPHHV